MSKVIQTPVPDGAGSGSEKAWGGGDFLWQLLCSQWYDGLSLNSLLGGFCPQRYMLHAICDSSGIISIRTLGGWMAPLHCACPSPIAIYMVLDRPHTVASQFSSSWWWLSFLGVSEMTDSQ